MCSSTNTCSGEGDCHCRPSSGTCLLNIHPKKWEDAIFPRGMVVIWQGDCLGSGLKAVVCWGITSMDRSLFRFVGKAAPHHGPALWAQGQVSFGTTVGFCSLKVCEITCIPQANSWCRDIHSCCSLLHVVPILVLVCMLSVFIDFLREKNLEVLSL